MTSDRACPKCGAPRGDTPECLRCGIIFAKVHGTASLSDVASSAPATEPVVAAAPRPLTRAVWGGDVESARLELRMRALAVPAALAGCALAVYAIPQALRIFLSMWVHETGHAVTAWFCGYFAFPGPWFTPISAHRSVVTVLALTAALSAWMVVRWRAGKTAAAALAGALLLLQWALTLGLSPTHAHALFIFGGDGGCFLLGALLMSTVYLPAEHPLRRGALRWGFLVIGAAGYVDAFHTWWAARTSVAAIPFGANEGVGLSDPSKLVDVYGWSIHALVSRYLWLAFACLASLVVLYVWGLIQARRALAQCAADALKTSNHFEALEKCAGQ